jgi:ferrous iron transport protein B
MRTALREQAATGDASGGAGRWLDERQLEAALKSSVFVPAQASHVLTERIDRILLDPWLGLPIFFGAMFMLFELVFILGKPIQDAMAWGSAAIRSGALEPALAGLPFALRGLMLDGVYNGLSTAASFVPMIVMFFCAWELSRKPPTCPAPHS